MAARLSRLILVLVLLVAAAVALATWRGNLWPFDLRASLLMTVSGLVGLAQIWWWFWIALSGAGAVLRGPTRLLLWLAGMVAVLVLHAAIGPSRGMLDLAELGVGQAILLYAVPVALALWTGALISMLLSRPQR
jgi:hypothetical protein